MSDNVWPEKEENLASLFNFPASFFSEGVRSPGSLDARKTKCLCQTFAVSRPMAYFCRRIMTEQFSSQILERAVSELGKLPGVGRRTALRLALHLLRGRKEDALALSESLRRLVEDVKFCHICHNVSDTDTCEICANPTRDSHVICVVENIQSVMSIENTGMFHGLYHVLGGVISPVDGIGPNLLEIDSLVERVARGGVEEVIFALKPTMEGDTTNFYISRKLVPYAPKLTTLARGLSVGDELEYADEVTLGRSIVNRVELKA